MGDNLAADIAALATNGMLPQKGGQPQMPMPMPMPMQMPMQMPMMWPSPMVMPQSPVPDDRLKTLAESALQLDARIGMETKAIHKAIEEARAKTDKGLADLQKLLTDRMMAKTSEFISVKDVQRLLGGVKAEASDKAQKLFNELSYAMAGIRDEIGKKTIEKSAHVALAKRVDDLAKQMHDLTKQVVDLTTTLKEKSSSPPPPPPPAAALPSKGVTREQVGRWVEEIVRKQLVVEVNGAASEMVTRIVTDASKQWEKSLATAAVDIQRIETYVRKTFVSHREMMETGMVGDVSVLAVVMSHLNTHNIGPALTIDDAMKLYQTYGGHHASAPCVRRLNIAMEELREMLKDVTNHVVNTMHLYEIAKASLDGVEAEVRSTPTEAMKRLDDGKHIYITSGSGDKFEVWKDPVNGQYHVVAEKTGTKAEVMSSFDDLCKQISKADGQMESLTVETNNKKLYFSTSKEK